MKYTWHTKEITCKADADAMVACYLKIKPRVLALDTETSGLHIMLDKPFIIQFGWVDEETKQGYSYAVDLERTGTLGLQVTKAALHLAAQTKTFVGHNLKYDLHMLKNIGFDYRTENMTDTMFYIRYGTDAVQESKGGAPLSLKAFAARYIAKDARLHEREIERERTAISAQFNRELKNRTGLRKKDLDEFFKDITNDVEDMPEQQLRGYTAWRESLPDWLQQRFRVMLTAQDIPYNRVTRSIVMKYALYDIVWTLEAFYILEPVVAVRQNQYAIEIENRLILPLLDMERVGFQIDREYLEQSRLRMKAYIINRRQRLYELANQEFSIGQHALIKKILLTRWNERAETTNSEALSRLESELKRSADPAKREAAEFISILQELRTLEKWYATYILRFQNNLQQTDRLYTTINQVGTVSGRVTSDFQQFPKDAIKDADGQELFSPRRMVTISKEEEYNALVYIDYSQIELRLQAMYTILVGHPEPNLCRAYMPFHCRREDGTPFNPEDPEDIKQWQLAWYLEESPEDQWHPLDVHAATTCHAFNITPDHPDFKQLRYHGKRINFAKNYGAQYGRIRQMFPEYPDEQIHQIDEAYYKAFPGVKTYHDYCYRLAASQAYGMNLFGVKYYNVSGHNLINMLIQGSGAFLLKLKIRELWEYARANGIKSRLQMNIHDELSWEKHRDETEVFFKFKEIMETWHDTLVPIVAEMEVSRTSWAEQQSVHSKEDLL